MLENVECQKESVTINSSETVATAAMKMRTNKVACLIVTFLRDGSLDIFRLGMPKLLERKGITTGGTDWPSLLEVIEYFQGLSFGPKSRSAGFTESLLNRLVTLAVIFDQTAQVTN